MDATPLAARLLEPVPVHRTFGLRAVRAADGSGEVALDVAEPVTNVIGALHASGYATLLDAAALAAMIGAVEAEDGFDGVLPLGTRAEVEFLAPAFGTLTARCDLQPAAIDGLRDVFSARTDRLRLTTHGTITDADGKLVGRGSFDWSVRRAPLTAPR